MLKTIDFSKMCDCKRGGNPVRLYKTDWFCTRCRKKTTVKESNKVLLPSTNMFYRITVNRLEIIKPKQRR